MRIICAVVVISRWEERKTERHPVKIPSLGIFTACFGVAEACQERENIADVMAIPNFVFVKIFYLVIVLKGVFFANGLA